MNTCAKCGVIVEPGELGILRACQQRDGSLLCAICDREADYAKAAAAIKRDVQPVQRRVA